MKVKDLIAKLQRFDKDLEIKVEVIGLTNPLEIADVGLENLLNEHQNVPLVLYAHTSK